jgi:large subunit ribosomal protein L16
MLLNKKRLAASHKRHTRRDVTRSLSKSYKFNKGSSSLQATESGKLSWKQLDSLSTTLKRLLKRNVKFWVGGYSVLPITKKGNDSRLGKGKGNIKYSCTIIRPGNTLLSIDSSSTQGAKFLATARYKLSVKTTRVYQSSRWVL